MSSNSSTDGADTVIQIIHLQGPREGETQRFTGKHITLGRSPDADVMYPPDLRVVSRNHAEIFCQDGRYLLVNHSKNGSFVNDEMADETWLYHGDVITLAPGGPKISFAPDAGTSHTSTEEVSVDHATQFMSVPDFPSDDKAEAITYFVIQIGDKIRSFKDHSITLGTAADCELRISHPNIRDHHMQLFFVEETYRARNLNADNLVLVNGIPIQQEINLTQGDEVLMHPDGPGFLFQGAGKFKELRSLYSSTSASDTSQQVHHGKKQAATGKGLMQFLKNLFRR